MSNVLLVIIPLYLAIILYVAQAAGYQFFLDRPGMAVTFIGYAIANVGLVWDALEMSR